MIVYIPISKNESIKQDVIDSIEAQDTTYHIVLNTMPGYMADGPEHYKLIAENRRDIVEKAKEADEPFMVMNDSRTVHLVNYNFKDMQTFLEKDPRHGAVALWGGKTILRSKHIYLRCVMFRRGALDCLKFELKELKPGKIECDCDAARRELEAAKWQISFLNRTGGRIKQNDR